MEPSQRKLSPLAVLRDVAFGVAIALLLAASFASLKPIMFEYLYRPFEGFAALLPTTGWAAVKVWAFWTVAAVIVGGLLLRSDPDLDLLDATIAGYLGVWIFAWIGGNLLGPIWLFRSWTIWVLLAVGGVSLWQRPPKVARRSLLPGEKLALLSFVLIGPVLLVVQLGSPVPPYMDVMATPAAAQRIITFGQYLPFDNDPYGYFGISSQLPGLELFYACLGLGSHTHLALLAETGAMVPMAGLLILTTYRLGRTIAGDVAGGMATLFLHATILFRTLPYMHGRTVAFILVGAGLAFFHDERRTTTRLVLSALLLGTAVGTHAIIGALGMLVAAATLLLWLLSAEIGAAIAGVGLLAGASLVAMPEVAVALRIVVPYPVLPVLQLLGVGLVVLSARRLEGRALRDWSQWAQWSLALYVIVALLWHPTSIMLNNHHRRFPVLVYGAGAGLVAMLVADLMATLRRRGTADGAKRERPMIAPVVWALVIGIVVEYWSNRLRGISTDPEIRFTVGDLFYKVDYWFPWVMAFPTGYLAAWLYRTVSPRVALVLVAAVLILPLRDRLDPNDGPDTMPDPNYNQHSIVQGWIYQLTTGKGGYWSSTGDRRWAQSPAEMGLIEALRGEIAAGRITIDTRLVLIEPEYVILYQDYLLPSVYTGIHGDPYAVVGDLDWDRSNRMQPIDKVPARLAERPPYVAIRGNPPVPPHALRGYTEIFKQNDVRLLREDSLGDARPARSKATISAAENATGDAAP